MAKLFAMDIGVPGVEVSVNYNTQNQRVTTVDWTLTAGIVARIRIWDNGTLIYDRSMGGPATGTENVPGNYRVVQVLDNDGTPFWDLPANLTWAIEMQTIG